MQNTDKARQALKIVCESIVEVIDNSSQTFGVPGGHLYAMLMQYMNLDTFEKIMGALVKAGKITKRGECYYSATKQ